MMDTRITMVMPSMAEDLDARLRVATQMVRQASRLICSAPEKLSPEAYGDLAYELRNLAHLAMGLCEQLPDLLLEAMTGTTSDEERGAVHDTKLSRRWALALLQRLADALETAPREELLDVRQHLADVLAHLERPGLAVPAN
jgi:hypothetical protein